MFSEIVIGIIIGLFFGIICGLIPGIHPNLISIVLFSSLVNMNTNSYFLLTFVISLAISNVILNFIPTVFLGIPDNGTELSLLPAHRLVNQGRSKDAIKLLIIGVIGAMILSPYLIIFSLYVLSNNYQIISNYMWLILSIISIMMILTEKNKKIAIFLFTLSGLIGIYSQQLPIRNEFILFPILTGLFGIPVLFNTNNEIPEQNNSKTTSKKSLYSAVFRGSLSGYFTSILPGISASIAALFSYTKNDEEYITSIGSIQIINTMFSILMLFFINKSRSGVAVFLKNFIELSTNNLKLILLTMTISISISILLTIYLSEYISNNINKINYNILNKSVLLLIFTITYILTNIYGVLLLILCSFLGSIPIISKTKRVHLMGCIIIPVIYYFIF